MKKITTIIFDFGGVLVTDTVIALEKRYGLLKKSENEQKEFTKFNYLCHLGLRPPKDFLKTIQKILAPNLSLQELDQFMTTTRLLPPWKLANKLSKNYKIIIFSNNQKDNPKKVAKKLRIKLFKFPFVNSSFVGMRKPQANFYNYLVKRFHLTPTECVFIDDHAENLEPARKLGMGTFRYQNNYASLVKFLKKTGVRGL
jgi:HAD superfamily hydrolase (TIGR01509 family)